MRKLEREYLSIHGYMVDQELEALDRWADEVWQRGGARAVEIGSWHGRTTILLARYFTVHAIDLWGNIEDGTKNPELIGKYSWPGFIENVVKRDLLVGEDQRIYPVCTNRQYLHEIKLKFDFAFVDGAHDYENCILDLVTCAKYLKKGGYLVAHDYKREGYPDFMPGVDRAVDEMIGNGWKVYEHIEGIIALRR